MPFECVSTSDTLSRALVEHSYPYREGAEVEDMGANATRISLRAVFFGPDYERGMLAFLEAIAATGAGELSHPIYGRRRVQVASCRDTFDAESPDSVQFEVEFVESLTREPFFHVSTPEAKLDAVYAETDAAYARASQPFSLSLATIPASGMMSRLEGVRALASSYLEQFRREVNGLQSAGLDVLLFPQSFMGDVRSAMQSVVSTQSAFQSVFAPAQASAAQASPVTGFEGVASRLAAMSAPIAPGTAYANGSPAPAQDAAIITAAVSLVSALALCEAAQAVFAVELATPAATPAQLEHIANTARTALQQQIDSQRALYPLEQSRPVVEALKTLALAVQTAARAVIETRPPLTARPAPVYGNLRLLAFAWYGDHSRAPELLALNTLREPNFIQPGQVLNAFAR